MFDLSVSPLDSNEYIECSIPDKILFSENFEHLVKECEYIVKKLSASSESGDINKGANSLNYIPFLKTIFDIQIEAHRLLSWLKLAIRVIQNRRWIAVSVQSLLVYKLSHFTRPVSLSMTLPFLGESYQKPLFSHASYSPRTVLAKDYMRVLKHIDHLWNKVGFHLRSFGENLSGLSVLLTLQNEISTLSSIAANVSEKTEVLFHSIECQVLTTNAPNIAAFYNGLKVENLRLKKLSRRLGNLQKLIQYLEGSSSEKPWFDLSTEGLAIVHLTKSKIVELVNRVHEVWLRQFELLETLKMIFGGVSQNQLPLIPQFNSTKLRSSSLPQSIWSNPDHGRQCLCFQRSPSSISEPCFTCLVCLRSCIDVDDTNRLSPRIHFKTSGESGFVSDSDNVLRRRRDDCKLTTLSKINRRWSFSHPSDILVSPCQSSKVRPNSSDRMGKSFEQITPVKQVQIIQHQGSSSIPARPFSLMNPIPASTKREYLAVEATLDAPLGRPYCTSSPRRPLSIVSTSTANADVTEFDLDSDDDIEHDLTNHPSQLGAGEPEDDSALVTSPTSYSLMSHEPSDQEEEEMTEDCYDDVVVSKRPGCLCRSLPILSNNASGDVGVDLSPLKETLKDPSFDDQAILVDTTMDEAYLPIATISSNDGDTCELEDGEDPAVNARLIGATTSHGCSADWSTLNRRSDDLANLASALRLSQTDSTRLHKVFQDGSKLIEWLSVLETSVCSSTPAEHPSSSKSLCRLQPEHIRESLNRHLHDLESSLEKVQSWQREVDELFTKHQKRFADFESQSSKLLASDHGLLVFFPSWLDTIASRCSDAMRKIRSQLRLSDYLKTFSDEREKVFQEVKVRTELLLAEADYLVEKLVGVAENNTDVSNVKQDIFTIDVMMKKLQDLLEHASELDPCHGLVLGDSIESFTDNHILRARLRNSLANLQNLHSRILSLPPTPSLSVSTPSQRCTGLQILMFTILALFSAFFFGFVQVVWLSEEEIRFHRACGSRKWVLCFSSVWSHSLCILLRTILPSIEPSSNDLLKVPPI
ncbi:unnamed protein product [Rodentolepis nana]|uniref:Vezatin domain-containing protein n=1 Tax=Rodentolepis nana TaxID=102285 RepID=A0A158QGM2_RODNA|nr:unnamed protein product [Rodentolepis nana]